MRGTVVFWVDRRGYGFVAPDEGGEDVFIHCSALRPLGKTNLSEGTVIDFDLAPSPRNDRPTAVNIKLLKEMV